MGEAFGTYIIAERNCEELVLIDKHAHERMLYEKKKQAPGSDSQMLLQPITVTLNKEEYTAVLQALDTFAKQVLNWTILVQARFWYEAHLFLWSMMMFLPLLWKWQDI